MLLLVGQAGGEALDGDLMSLQFPLGLVQELQILLLQGILPLPDLPAQLLQLVLQVLEVGNDNVIIKTVSERTTKWSLGKRK